MTTEVAHEADEILLGFTRALRSAGLAVTHDRATSFLRAASLVGAGDPLATYRAGVATLCGSPDDLVRYGHVFEAWFGAREQLPRTVARDRPREISPPLPTGESGEEGGESTPEVVQAAASDTEAPAGVGGRLPEDPHLRGRGRQDEALKAAPIYAPRRRLDETLAARKPMLAYQTPAPDGADNGEGAEVGGG